MLMPIIKTVFVENLSAHKEATVAVLEDFLEVRPQQVHHQDVVVVLRGDRHQLREAVAAFHYAQHLGFLGQRLVHVLALLLELDRVLDPRRCVAADEHVTEAPTSDSVFHHVDSVDYPKVGNDLVCSLHQS